jgi:hypothetical protein
MVSITFFTLIRTAHSPFSKPADSLFRPITTVRRNGPVLKKIPWSAFRLTDADWERANDARDISNLPRFRYDPMPEEITVTRTRLHRATVSRLSIFPPYGVHSLQSKRFRLHGRPIPTTHGLLFIRMRSVRASPSYRNTVRGLMRSLATF